MCPPWGGVVVYLATRPRPPLPWSPRVICAQRLGQRLDRRLESRSSLRVQPSVSGVHPRYLTDEELAPLEVLFHVEAEAVWIHGMPGAGRDIAQVLDREPAGVVDPHLLVDADLELVYVLLEVADHRGRLIADLTRAQSLREFRHRLELLAHAEPVGSCSRRDLAGLGNPGAGGLPGEQVIAPLARPVNHPRKHALETVDDRGKSLGVYE